MVGRIPWEKNTFILIQHNYLLHFCSLNFLFVYFRLGTATSHSPSLNRSRRPTGLFHSSTLYINCTHNVQLSAPNEATVYNIEFTSTNCILLDL